MRDIKKWTWLVLFGSLWGLSEVAGGGILYTIEIPGASIFLAAWAFLILAVARGIVDKPGSSIVIGAVLTYLGHKGRHLWMVTWSIGLIICSILMGVSLLI